LTDAVFAVGVLVGAVFVTSGLWADPKKRVLSLGSGDQVFFEWLMGYGPHILKHGADPFFASFLNVPFGVNLAANTSVTVLSILFSPLTAISGPAVTFTTVLTLNLAGSAIAWRMFFIRFLTPNRLSATAGALLLGFAPGLISHANGHLNWTAGWIAPLIIWRTLKLRQLDHVLRNGLCLGGAVVVAFSVTPEGLFLTALAMATFFIVWVTDRKERFEVRKSLPRLLAGLAIAASVSGLLLAYPLYMHFAGPQSFTGTGYSQRYYSEEPLSYLSYPRSSIGGMLGLSFGRPPNASEATSFLGITTWLIVAVAVLRAWRAADIRKKLILRALLIVTTSFLVLSLGPRLRFGGHESDIPLPYAALARFPLFDAALPCRFALVVVAATGMLLVLGIDSVREKPDLRRRKAWLLGSLAGLLLLTPTPLPTTERPPVPAFITSGLWQQVVPPGGTLMTLPLTSDMAPDGQRWQAFTMAHGSRVLELPGGYFLGPGGEDGRGRGGTVPVPTSTLLEQTALSGQVPPIADAEREQAKHDLARWRVRAIVMPDVLSRGVRGTLHRQALVETATLLFGPPRRMSDVLVWTR
jgi:hypothetical protein